MNSFVFLWLSPFKLPLGDAALYAVLGAVIVFAVLAILVGLLTVFKYVFKIQFGKKPKPETSMPAPVLSDADNDEEVAAVIAAVIAYMDGEEQSVKAPFVVKSITKLK